MADNSIFEPRRENTRAVLMKGLPEADTLMDDVQDVPTLSNDDIDQISTLRKTPTYHQALNDPSLLNTNMSAQMHGVKNLGVRYQNRSNPSEVHENTVERDTYERQISALQKAPATFFNGTNGG